MEKLTTQEFIEKAKQVHGDKYNYSKTEYKNSQTKACIICPEHGEFWQTPNNHLSNHGCPKCKAKLIGLLRKNNIEEFIEKAKQVHGDKYNYNNSEYIGVDNKICIVCSKHGEFWQTPHDHLNGHGCPICANTKKLTTQEFIEKAKQVHGDKYNYNKVDYTNNHTKVCITCPEHGEFWQTPNDHLNGHGCFICKESKGEKLVRIWCEQNNLINNKDYIMQYRAKWLGRQTLDFFFPKFNIGIEYDGRQHFIPIKFFGGENRLKKQKQEDIQKEIACKNNNIKLIRISDLSKINDILYEEILKEKK